MMIMHARVKYGTAQWSISRRYSRCVRHQPMCRQQCEPLVNRTFPYLCVEAGTTGLEGLCAITASSSTCPA